MLRRRFRRLAHVAGISCGAAGRKGPRAKELRKSALKLLKSLRRVTFCAGAPSPSRRDQAGVSRQAPKSNARSETQPLRSPATFHSEIRRGHSAGHRRRRQVRSSRGRRPGPGTCRITCATRRLLASWSLAQMAFWLDIAAFLLKALIIVAALGGLAVLIARLTVRRTEGPRSRSARSRSATTRCATRSTRALDKKERKALAKARKKEAKAEAKARRSQEPASASMCCLQGRHARERGQTARGGKSTRCSSSRGRKWTKSCSGWKAPAAR